MKNKYVWLTIPSCVLFLLFFSYKTSPLFPCSYGWDSAFFQLVGEGMTKGYLPYRDFFDMKGPWLFLIQYAAQLLYHGRTGIFILQCINLVAVTFLCIKIFTKYYGGGSAVRNFFVLLPFALILSATMEGGNLTEEWSLAFLLLCLYSSLDFIMGDALDHSPKSAFFYGVCFGIIALNRITNSVLICAIILTVLIELIRKKRWKNLLQNALLALLGILAAFVPPLLYFGYFGEIQNMLYCTFVFGFIYGTEGYGFGAGMPYLATLFFPLAIYALTGLKKKRLWAVTILNTLGMCITLGMGGSSMHDYILVIPNMMLGVWRLAEFTAGMDKAKWRHKALMFLLSLLLCFSYPCYKMAGSGLSILKEFGDRTDYDKAKEIARFIPESEKDSVLGYAVPLRWYTINDIMPCSRYCGWQEHYMELSPKVENEITEMFETTPPKWIVTSAAAQIENPTVKTALEKNYLLTAKNDSYFLYQIAGQ